MYKERLIESFTWLFMQVEVDFLENILNHSMSDIVYKMDYYAIRKYIDCIEYNEMNELSFDEDFESVLDYMINLNQEDKVKMNLDVMKKLKESQILELIIQTTKLLQFNEYLRGLE